MKRIVLTVLVCVMAVVNIVSAELVQGIDIDFVTIANPGNPGDTRTDYPDSADPYGAGAVGYEYQIGKYEITNGQWNSFVSEAGAPTGNPGNAYDDGAFHTGNKMPTGGVSWYEAAQFCNYLTSGDKSKGAYQFSGDNTSPADFLGIDRDLAISIYGTAYVIPTESEWYKAAYYTGSGYSTYANGTDVAPVAGVDTNYGALRTFWEVGVGNGTMEQNGTFDMMGNIYEWHETMISGSYRGVRGGYSGSRVNTLRSSDRPLAYPYRDFSNFGFRVASVPEPTTLLLLGLGAVMVRKRRRI